MEITAY